jgi:hypothetical protein
MTQEIHTATARTFIDAGKILYVEQSPGSEQTLEHACENVAASVKVAAGKKWPMLVDMSKVKSITREARERYASPKNEETITACAIVVGSRLNRFIGNFFIGLNRAPVPTRLFDSPADARAWLLQFA